MHIEAAMVTAISIQSAYINRGNNLMYRRKPYLRNPPYGLLSLSSEEVRADYEAFTSTFSETVGLMFYLRGVSVIYFLFSRL